MGDGLEDPKTTYDRRASSCVACSAGTLERKFSKQVLGRYEAAFFQCAQCGTLQISDVYWLPEAYGAGARFDLDTGAAQRGLVCALFIRAMRMAGLLPRGAKVVDFGAGSGLCVRLLRDLGFDAYGFDKYTQMPFCRDFRIADLTAEGGLNARLITAFEVFEHLPDPAATLELLARNLGPGGAILLATSLYDPAAHGPDWEYLNPQHGQHINFFSRTGLSRLAGRVKTKVVCLPFNFYLVAPESAGVGAFRRLMLFIFSAAMFMACRLGGLCRFKYANLDNRALSDRMRE
ncbi:MAG: class I SAM-dependent methyltransferase [Phycisphaerae bacterium]